MGQLAANWTLFDNFFHSAFGPSLLNHFWLACACTPVWESSTAPPSSIVAVLDPVTGIFTNPSSPAITPDGHIIGTLSPSLYPIDPSYPTDELVPPLHNRTIGDDLIAAGVSWAYFQDGYADAIAGNASPAFEYNHNPFLYFSQFANGTEYRDKYLADTNQFIADLQSGNLPSVSFVKPMQPHNFHPHVSDRADSQAYLKKLIDAITASSVWSRSIVIVTFDEHDGFFDHVPPPKGDIWGPGSRVPAIVISPFAKKGYIDSTESETLSIHRLIQRRFNLPILGDRNVSSDLTSALVFPTTTTTTNVAISSHAISMVILGLVGILVLFM